jgi:hypothetical protein
VVCCRSLESGVALAARTRSSDDGQGLSPREAGSAAAETAVGGLLKVGTHDESRSSARPRKSALGGHANTSFWHVKRIASSCRFEAQCTPATLGRSLMQGRGGPRFQTLMEQRQLAGQHGEAERLSTKQPRRGNGGSDSTLMLLNAWTVECHTIRRTYVAWSLRSLSANTTTACPAGWRRPQWQDPVCGLC